MSFVVTVTHQAKSDLNYWKKKNPKVLKKILLILTILKDTPFTGAGKPEPLKYAYTGCWSRRINREHRLVYHVSNDQVTVLACRYHYS